jgi:hypothetical protein
MINQLAGAGRFGCQPVDPDECRLDTPDDAR